MTYTILSARYANEDNTAAIIITKEAAAVLASQKDTPDLWETMLVAITPEPYDPPETAPVVKTWTPLQFMEEFTYEERVALRGLAKSDPMAEDWLDLLKASTAVRMDDPRTTAGLNYMVLKGVLTQSRVDEITTLV